MIRPITACTQTRAFRVPHRDTSNCDLIGFLFFNFEIIQMIAIMESNTKIIGFRFLHTRIIIYETARRYLGCGKEGSAYSINAELHQSLRLDTAPEQKIDFLNLTPSRLSVLVISPGPADSAGRCSSSFGRTITFRRTSSFVS